MSSPRTIAITGAEGLIGRHLRIWLHALGAPWQARPVPREACLDPVALASFLTGCEAVVHLAGMNRGDDATLEATNLALTDTLTAALTRVCPTEGPLPHVVFASSTHRLRPTAYGRSKRESELRLSAWAAETSARLTILELPHVFGEGGKPFHNSVVSTFCHQLATGTPPTLLQDGDLELLHAGTLAETITTCLDDGTTEPIRHVRLGGIPLKVSALLAQLQNMDNQYRGGLLPALPDALCTALFNTYRSYLPSHFYPLHPTLHQDARGALFEGVKTLGGGQCFVSTTHPGVTRGGHYHRRKFERFIVLQGEAEIRLRPVLAPTGVSYRVGGDQPALVDMPTLVTHDITNVGTGELITLFWSSECFDPADPDTYREAP